MTFRTRGIQSLSLTLLLLAAAAGYASDEVVVDLPDPFKLPCIKQERIGAVWRHGLHTMREKFTHYFEVYPEDLDGYKRPGGDGEHSWRRSSIPENLAGYEPTTLEKVKENPAFYLDRNIQFDVHYARTGNFYRPFLSPFHEDGYVNFAVWPYGVELWLKEVRGDVSPLFYLDKQLTQQIDLLAHVPTYTPLHVWGSMRAKSQGLPWIEIRGLEVIKETTFSEAVLRHMESGVSQMRQKRYDLAAQLMEQAISLEMPVFAEAKTFGLLGRIYYEERLFRTGRNALVNAYLRDNNVVSILVLLARDDLRVDPEDGNFAAEGREAAERAIAAEPTNPEAHAELGLALAMLGDIRAGYREVDFAQKLAPRGQLPEANRNRAMIALLEKNLELAKQELNQAVILRATDYTLHLELGDVHLAMGHLEDARREYTQSKELAPLRGEPFYKTALVLKLQGEALEKDGKKDEAVKLYTEALDNVKNAIAKDIHMTRAYALAAELLRKLGRDDEAKKIIDQGASINANYPHMQDVYYEQAAAEHDWEGMEKATRAALGNKRDAVHLSHLGKVLALRPNPDYKGAADALAEAVRLRPSSGDDFALLGHIRFAGLSDANGAAEALHEAVRIQPKNGAAWLELALIHRSLGDTAATIEATHTAAEILNTDEAHLLEAQALLDRNTDGDAAKAAEIAQALETAAKSDADKAHAQAMRAAALLAQNKADEALELATSAGNLQKDDPFINLVQGKILLAKGDFPGAKEHLSNAVAQAQNAPVALGAGIRGDAQRALTEVDAKAGAVVVQNNSETKTTDGDQPTTKRPAPPVTEEGNGSTQPVPAQVPGPR